MKRASLRDNGFSLVEVTLALGVAAFSLIAIFGLLPIGLQTQRNATEQTAAPGILSAIAADMRATPPAATTSQRFNIPIPANSTSSSTTLFFNAEGEISADPSGSRYRVLITFSPNAAGSNAATFAALQLTWPAAATPENAAGAVESFIALARN